MKRVHTVFITATLIGLSFGLVDRSYAGDGKPDAKYTAQEAISLLKKGNERFYSDTPDNSNQSKKFRSELVNNQHPHSVVLASADSRVIPEYIFNQGFGQIYSVRTTGLALDHNSIGSIEHAVSHLGARLIVVMGNDNCETIRAAYDVPEDKSAGSKHLDKILNFMRPGIEKFKKVSESDRTLFAAAKANVFAASKHLVKESKIIFDKIKNNEVTIVQAIYNMNTGKVEFSDNVGPILSQMIQSEKSPSRKVSSDASTEPSDKPEKKEKKKKKKDSEEKKLEKPEEKKEEKKDTSATKSWENTNKKDSY